jgi:hypothetical protein
MIGFDNPWGVLLRKECETIPLGLMGIYDLLIALATYVPVAKCMCIDATKGGNFRTNALDQCYNMAPTHMKPIILGLLEGAVLDPERIDVMCRSLTEFAADHVSKSMHPWFAKQLDASAAIASSLDYLLRSFDVDAGRCMDFESNPFATVLIPEPFDYFAGCASTTQCALQCAVEMDAFDEAFIRYLDSPQPRVTNTQTRSYFFNDMNEDSTMPMKIVTLVELLNCDVVCGGDTDRVSCIAVAGLSLNNTILVMKYCIPQAVGYSVRSEPTETWTVWGSEEWTDSALDIQFADTMTGDTLVVLRDGIGNTRGEPNQQFVTVHPRQIQQDAVIWDRWYSTEEYRLPRLMFARAGSKVINQGRDSSRNEFRVISIRGMFVFPQHVYGESAYVVLSTINDMGLANNVAVDHTDALCGKLDLTEMINTRNSQPIPILRCSDMKEFFNLGFDQGYVPVIFSDYSTSVSVAQVPTVSKSPLKVTSQL